ncbi:MAG: class I SAM-dependent methyltransferase [Candidatus Hermodarchaeota archaeon]
MEVYWNNRFIKETKIWGVSPSSTALHALALFQKYKVKKVLIPGSGYGRNSKLFSNHNFSVDGIEISEIAINIAKMHDEKSRFYHGNILNMPFNEVLYDAIYCYNTLHLFLENNRFKIIDKCYKQLKNNGVLFIVVFSDKESSYGNGKEIEENTFETKPGRPVHYFSESDLINHFNMFKILETGIMVDHENHGVIGKHSHNLRYIFAKKEVQ